MPWAVVGFLLATIHVESVSAQGLIPNAYVSLGDSYTAAPLVPNPVGEPIDCGRSDHNYPSLVAESLKAPVFRDVSCGSAQTKHFPEPQNELPLGGTNPPQYDGLGPDVALVTVGIGGNDVGFGDAVERCVQPPAPLGTPCKPYYTQGGRDQVSEKIAQVAPRIAKVLTELHNRAPNASVFLVGYPALLPDDGSSCYPYVPVLPEDVPWISEKNRELNAMLKDQASAIDATYVDWYTPSIGHDMCKLPGTAWTNGAVIVPPSYPAHPNADGEAGAATAVIGAIESSGFMWPTKLPATSRGSVTAAPGGNTSAITPQLPATGGAPWSAANGLALTLIALALRARLHKGNGRG